MRTQGRDRLRELLDAVLDEGNRTLEDMAGDAHTTRAHFARTVSGAAGEGPGAMRRRVMLERAAWQLRHGASVADAAWAAGYASAEGFSRAFARAFGHPPSAAANAGAAGAGTDAGHWLPSPNGIHFHPPTSLWVRSGEHPMNPLAEQLVRHDLDDTAHLLRVAAGLDAAELRRARMPGHTVLAWDGEEASIGAVLDALVFAKEVWLAALEGLDLPARRPGDDPVRLLARQEGVARRWIAAIRDIDRRGAWDDRLIDALCDPPESFVLSAVVAHVLTYSAHRRQLVRSMLRAAGRAIDEGDPILWLRARRGESDPGHPDDHPAGRGAEEAPARHDPSGADA